MPEFCMIYPGSFSRGEVVLDIHTYILGGDRIHCIELLISIGQEEIFKEAQLTNTENTAGILRQVFQEESNINDGQLYWKRVLQILGSFKT